MFGGNIKILEQGLFGGINNVHFKNHGLLISHSGLVYRLLNGLDKVLNFSMPHFNLYSRDKLVTYFMGML